MLTQIVFVEPLKFTTMVVEATCKKAGIKCYSVSDYQEIPFLISDLEPEFVIISANAIEDQDAFKIFYEENLEQFSDKLVLFSEESFLNSGVEFKHHLPKPLNPDQLIEKLESML